MRIVCYPLLQQILVVFLSIFYGHEHVHWGCLTCFVAAIFHAGFVVQKQVSGQLNNLMVVAMMVVVD
jgi:hypothetical protein